METNPYKRFKVLCVSREIEFDNSSAAFNTFALALAQNDDIPRAWTETANMHSYQPRMKRVEAEGVGDNNNGFYEVGMPSAPNPVEHSAEQHAFEQSPYGKQRRKIEREAAEEIAQMFNKLFDRINSFGNSKLIADQIHNAITAQHRTLQQDYWRIMFDVIDDYGRTAYFDGRNEASVRMCADVTHFRKGLSDALPRI